MWGPCPTVSRPESGCTAITSCPRSSGEYNPRPGVSPVPAGLSAPADWSLLPVTAASRPLGVLYLLCCATSGSDTWTRSGQQPCPGRGQQREARPCVGLRWGRCSEPAAGGEAPSAAVSLEFLFGPRGDRTAQKHPGEQGALGPRAGPSPDPARALSAARSKPSRGRSRTRAPHTRPKCRHTR